MMDKRTSKIKNFINALTNNDGKMVELNFNDGECQITKLDNGMYNMKFNTDISEEAFMYVVDAIASLMDEE